MPILSKAGKHTFIDAHCHFFTKSMLSPALLSHMAKYDYHSILKSLKLFPDVDADNIMRFLDIGLAGDGIDIFKSMQNCYSGEFIAVPLMLDVTYACHHPGEHGGISLRDLADRMIAGQAKSQRAIDRAGIWAQRLLYKVIAALELHKTASVPFSVFENSYERQVEDLTKVKQSYGELVYPFFSIDPRRNREFNDGILGEIKRHVGPGNTFTGIKIYTSMGYSPTDPRLYSESGHETVYSWCQANNVPITVHSAPEGFSHLADFSHINGDVYHPESGDIVPASHLNPEGRVEHIACMKCGNTDDVFRERLILLNHPKLWLKVLQRYPRLKINFAHCGGNDQLYKMANDLKSGYWSRLIIEMMAEFKNVYTDLSCFSEKSINNEVLLKYRENVYKKMPLRCRRKVLYGSDYYMLSLFGENLVDYRRKFERVFEWDFNTLSNANAVSFLGLQDRGWLCRFLGL